MMNACDNIGDEDHWPLVAIDDGIEISEKSKLVAVADENSLSFEFTMWKNGSDKPSIHNLLKIPMCKFMNISKEFAKYGGFDVEDMLSDQKVAEMNGVFQDSIAGDMNKLNNVMSALMHTNIDRHGWIIIEHAQRTLDSMVARGKPVDEALEMVNGVICDYFEHEDIDRLTLSGVSVE